METRDESFVIPIAILGNVYVSLNELKKRLAFTTKNGSLHCLAAMRSVEAAIKECDSRVTAEMAVRVGVLLTESLKSKVRG